MSRKRASEIWNYMEVDVGCDTAMCLICKSHFKYSKGSTSNLLKHVKTKHQLEFEGKKEPSTSCETVSVETPVRAMSQPTLASALDRNKPYPRDWARKRELDQLDLRFTANFCRGK
ncbi:hypothetical protein RRG08_010031 [Elysia crispata]|uniref:BED-type domain-containing protein n=1 Tax=Elysia crispata TaxID=231223 RepID=A0AAE1CR73_9GAST|nr:hypothetical protein RRG08_010031 [Elysia crispata]